MYELILNEKIATILASILLALLASSLVGARKLWLRGVIYNLIPVIGAAFYIVAFLAQHPSNSVDLIAGLMFETTTLIIFFKLFSQLKNNIIFINETDSNKILKLGLVLHILISLPIITSSNFGIFSEGSRIDYLYTSSLAKYFTYMGALIGAAYIPFLASKITNRTKLGYLGWTIITAMFGLSVLSGSKGGIFLWLLAVASLIDYKEAKIPVYKIITTLLVTSFAIFISILIVGKFLNLDMEEFIQIATSRFFLNNDARALALDLRTSESTDFNLFSEAFRSLGTLFGLAPRNTPLGAHLYSEAFAVTDGRGANASFMALVTYYFPIGYALLPAILGMVGLAFVAKTARVSTNLFSKPAYKAIVISIWLNVLVAYSQDFLAFQIITPLAILSILILWVMRGKLYVTTTK